MKKAVFPLIVFLCFGVFTAFGARNMRVLVYPFENQGTAEYSWIAAGMTDSVIADLGRISSITVISDDDRKKVMREIAFSLSDMADEKTAVRVGLLTGADTIFTGSYTVVAGRVRVVAKLVDVERGNLVKSIKLDGTLEGIFELQDRIVFSLMTGSGEIKVADVKAPVVTNTEKTNIETKMRPSLSAYEYYSKGLELQNTNPVEALRLFKEALAKDPEYIDALKLAGYTAGFTLNQFEPALGYLQKAIEILRKRKETATANFAYLMISIGTVYWSKGELGKALESYMKAEGIYERLGFKTTADYSDLMICMGIVYWTKGELDRALEYYLKSKNIRESLSLQNTFVYAHILNDIGLVYKDKGEYDRALEYHIKAKGIYERFGMQKTVPYANAIWNMGIAYFSKGEVDRAFEYYLKSKEIRESLGLEKTKMFANLLLYIGRVYNYKKEYNRALEHYNKAREILDSLELSNTIEYANLLYCMAEVYENKGKKPEAGKLYRRSYETYNKAGYTGKWKDKVRKDAERLGW